MTKPVDHAEKLYKALRDLSSSLVSQGLGRPFDSELKQALAVLVAYRATRTEPIIQPPLEVFDVKVDDSTWTGMVFDVDNTPHLVRGIIRVHTNKHDPEYKSAYAGSIRCDTLTLSLSAINEDKLNAELEKQFDYVAYTSRANDMFDDGGDQ